MEISQSDEFIGKFGKFKGERVKIISANKYDVVFGTETDVENIVQAHILTRFFFEEAFEPAERAPKKIVDNFFESLTDLFLLTKTELSEMREKEIIGENQALLITMMIKRLIQHILNNRGKYDL